MKRAFFIGTKINLIGWHSYQTLFERMLIMNTKLLLSSAALAAVSLALPLNAMATTVQTETVVKTQNVEGTTQINFSKFDSNGDNILTMPEVGENLFYMFDQDGNELIDNIEWDNRNVYTITPMETETFRFVDYDSDGVAEKTTYTYDTFYSESGLARFDNDKNGLSAQEFIGDEFKRLDIDMSGTLDLEEWKAAYIASLSPPNANQKRYNK